jgi:hypothetical protein
MARDRRMARVLSAYAGLELTDSMTAVTVTLYAFAGGGATFAGLPSFAYLPAAFAAPFIGDVGARASRGTRLAVSYATTAALLGVVSVLVLVEGPLLAVVVAAAVVNIAHSASRPSHYAALPQLASSPAVLVRANSTTSFVNGLVGPALAGCSRQQGWRASGARCRPAAGASLACSSPAGRDRPVMLLVAPSSLSYRGGGAEILMSPSRPTASAGRRRDCWSARRRSRSSRRRYAGLAYRRRWHPVRPGRMVGPVAQR